MMGGFQCPTQTSFANGRGGESAPQTKSNTVFIKEEAATFATPKHSDHNNAIATESLSWLTHPLDAVNNQY